MTHVQPAKRPWQLTVFPVFALVGWALIVFSFLVGALVLTPTAQDYWGDNPKLVRDQAQSGDPLLDDLATLNSTNRWKEPLTFIGVAAFMVGIALEFSSIPRLLQNRGQVIHHAFQYLTRS